MTRAHINITLPNGKVLHWYHNGDQYPDGVRDWYGMTVLIHNLYEGASCPTFHNELTDENVTRIVQAYYRFAYVKLFTAEPLVPINKPVFDDGEDFNYHIDLMNKQVTIKNWGKVIFQTHGNAEKGAYLEQARQFLMEYREDYRERKLIDQKLNELGLARTAENVHKLLAKVSAMQESEFSSNLATAADFLSKEMQQEKIKQVA